MAGTNRDSRRNVPVIEMPCSGIVMTRQFGSFYLMWENAPYATPGVASHPHPPTLDKTRRDRTHLVSAKVDKLRYVITSDTLLSRRSIRWANRHPSGVLRHWS